MDHQNKQINLPQVTPSVASNKALDVIIFYVFIQFFTSNNFDEKAGLMVAEWELLVWVAQSNDLVTSLVSCLHIPHHTPSQSLCPQRSVSLPQHLSTTFTSIFINPTSLFLLLLHQDSGMVTSVIMFLWHLMWSFAEFYGFFWGFRAEWADRGLVFWVCVDGFMWSGRERSGLWGNPEASQDFCGSPVVILYKLGRRTNLGVVGVWVSPHKQSAVDGALWSHHACYSCNCMFLCFCLWYLQFQFRSTLCFSWWLSSSPCLIEEVSMWSVECYYQSNKRKSMVLHAVNLMIPLMSCVHVWCMILSIFFQFFLNPAERQLKSDIKLLKAEPWG